MVIKIKPNFTQAQIKKFIEDKLNKVHTAIVSRFQRVGETFVTNARDNGTYGDVTGNLRSSIGYVILKDGVQLFENFSVASRGKYGGAKAVNKKKYGGLKGEEGVSAAKASAEKVSERYPIGYVLICVAGMDYAAVVESRGKDVITASSKIADVQLKQAIKSIQTKLI